jgi:signal transduction histidine kinase
MANNSKPKILAVDDNEVIRYALRRSLQEGGYDVIEARTGAEALTLARREPALITLDINLPDMDGFEVCRKLKEDPATSEIPILHISASFAEIEHRVRGLEGGADAYLSEPVNQQELLATVKALLRLSYAQQEARRQAGEAEKARQELKKINENLESRVRERTAELERRNLEVHELSRRLLHAQDEERRRVSRELHDSTGQLLVVLNINLARLKADVFQNQAEAEKLLDESNAMVEEMSRQIRTLSYLLHPPLLDEAGLASAVKWYVEGFGSRSNIEVSLELSNDLGRLSRDLETTVFRLIQESLTNIHRHSGSKTAAVRVERKGQELRVEIADAGKGLASNVMGGAGPNPRLGVGILGMKERVSRLGGSFEIISDATGTAIRASLPTDYQTTALTA